MDKKYMYALTVLAVVAGFGATQAQGKLHAPEREITHHPPEEKLIGEDKPILMKRDNYPLNVIG